jgi:hypothetical protein
MMMKQTASKVRAPPASQRKGSRLPAPESKPKLRERELTEIMEKVVDRLNEEEVRDMETYEHIMLQLEEQLVTQFSNVLELDFDGDPIDGDAQVIWVRFVGCGNYLSDEESRPGEEMDESDDSEDSEEEDSEEEDSDESMSDDDGDYEEYEFTMHQSDGAWNVEACGWA